MTDEQAVAAFWAVYEFLDRYGVSQDKHRFDWQVVHRFFTDYWTGRSDRSAPWHMACGEIRSIYPRRPTDNVQGQEYVCVMDSATGDVHKEITAELNALIKKAIS